MNHELFLIHRSGPERLRADGLDVFSFATCLRHVVLLDASELSQIQESLRERDEVLRGEQAYRFLLEVICGLHSPLIGETEVYGQFKTAVSEFHLPATPWGSQLAKVFKSLFEDAKRIRDLHLKDLGSQSYGSVLRREVRGLKELHIVGAGHLVQEILPWVTKETLRITVHCRDPRKAKAELALKLDANQLERLRIVSLNERFGLREAEALVIAAPLSSDEISHWLADETALRFIADLRADSSIDRLVSGARVLELGEFTSRLSENQAVLQAKKSSALDAIQQASHERSRAVEYRPFGWDDVCA